MLYKEVELSKSQKRTGHISKLEGCAILPYLPYIVQIILFLKTYSN
jgi:hypothetical protein